MARQSDGKIVALLPLISANGNLAMTKIIPIIVAIAIAISLVRTGTGLAMQAGSSSDKLLTVKLEIIGI